ncbi:MAG: hypothetical protein RR869_08755 [Lachnospiraceae bacterium]
MKKSNKNLIKRKETFFSFLLIVMVLINGFTVSAKEADTIKRERTFTTSTKNKKEYPEYLFEKKLIKGQKIYQLSKTDYSVKKETLLTKMSKNQISEVITEGTEYKTPPVITENGITYKLVKTDTEEKIITERQSQPVTGFDDYDYQVTANTVPKTKEISATNVVTGEVQSISCNLTGVTQYGQKTVSKQMTITFYDYDSLYYQIGDDLVEKNDSQPPLQGYEGELLRMVGAEQGASIADMAWDGGVYESNGQVCRDAVATVLQTVTVYRASYGGSIQVPEEKGTIYQSTYEGLDPAGKKEYEMEATATYQLLKTKNMLPVYMGIGIGILIVIGTIISILFLLTKKKKKQEEL